jgi:hypothetical protein
VGFTFPGLSGVNPARKENPAMSIALSCPCGNTMRIRDELSAKRVRCPECGEVLRVPAASVAESPLQRDSAASRLPPKKRSRKRQSNSGRGGRAPQTRSPGASRSGFNINADTLRIVVLVLIAVDAVQVGVWSVFSLNGISRMMQSFGGLLTLFASIGALGFSWVARLLQAALRGVAIPLGILACLFHSEWR